MMTKTASLTDLDRRATTADRILDAAETLFAERGFAGTAVRDIAGQVGLNAASLYNHFPGKKELYEAVLERGLRPIFEMLTELAGADWSPARDERAIDTIMDHLAAKPNLARLLHQEALRGGDNITRIAGRLLEPIYRQGLEALKASPALDGWPEDQLPLLVMALHNLVLGYFSMAPLHAKLTGIDPLSEQALRRQKEFLARVTQRLIGRTSS